MGIRCKLFHSMVGLILVVLISVPVAIEAYVVVDSYKQCENTVKKWASFSTDSEEVDNDKHALRDLLFFLHIPRTGGRTYYHCFLKKLYSNSQECPRSYDKLRFDPRKSNCRLLTTHDDYSMMSKLPKEKTSVVTILRNPIERVFSTYEFSVEVASRFLIHPNLTSVARTTKRLRRKTSGMSTLDIWPWKYLVPWMREDLFNRRDTRKFRGRTHLVTNNSYDMEDIVMPMHKYINDPIARDIIHNGATFQITGLTNNSYFSESHEVRHCVLNYRSLGKYVLEVAKKKLDDMLYVGLTENHKESANMFAEIVGAQVISKHGLSNSSADVAANDDSEHDSSLSADHVNNTYQTLKNVSSINEDDVSRENWNIYHQIGSSAHQCAMMQMYKLDCIMEKRVVVHCAIRFVHLHQCLTVGKLMEAYESCISPLRKSQSGRRANSLKQISPVIFTKEARRKVPKVLIQEIESLNSLDMELYKYARHIFTKQQTLTTHNMVYDEKLSSTLSTSAYLSFYDNPSRKFLLFSVTGLLLLLFVFFFVNSRRRRISKVKL